MLNRRVGSKRERTGSAAALGIAFAGVVGLSSLHCGDEVTADNIGPKLTAAFCDAWSNCCASQGYPLSAETRMICEGTATASLYNPGGYVFNQDIAELCLKAARSYQCRDHSSIDAICRDVFSDPADPATRPDYRPEGAACAGLGTCAFYDGLTCVIDNAVASTGTCQKWSAVGGACSGDLDCEVRLYCDAMKTCRERLPDGSPCTSTTECQSTNCMGGVCVTRGACSQT